MSERSEDPAIKHDAAGEDTEFTKYIPSQLAIGYSIFIFLLTSLFVIRTSLFYSCSLPLPFRELNAASNSSSSLVLLLKVLFTGASGCPASIQAVYQASPTAFTATRNRSSTILSIVW